MGRGSRGSMVSLASRNEVGGLGNASGFMFPIVRNDGLVSCSTLYFIFMKTTGGPPFQPKVYGEFPR